MVMPPMAMSKSPRCGRGDERRATATVTNSTRRPRSSAEPLGDVDVEALQHAVVADAERRVVAAGADAQDRPSGRRPGRSRSRPQPAADGSSTRGAAPGRGATRSTDARLAHERQRLTRRRTAGKTARMATLTAEEFAQTVRCLADDLGLQRLRDKLVRLNALVARGRAASADALANQLYMLTGGLRRQVPATIAVQGLWSEQMNQRLGEDGEKALETLAEKINACLGERDSVDSGEGERARRAARRVRAAAGREGRPRARAHRHAAEGGAGGGGQAARDAARRGRQLPTEPAETLDAGARRRRPLCARASGAMLLPRADRSRPTLIAAARARSTSTSRASSPTRARSSAGDLFVCLPGYRSEGGETRADRHDFIPAARRSAAPRRCWWSATVGADRRRDRGARADAWTAVAAAAARYYRPSVARRSQVVGVTGTSGKTSTTYFVERCSPRPGGRWRASARSSTASATRVLPAAQTTPEAPLLQSLLRVGGRRRLHGGGDGGVVARARAAARRGDRLRRRGVHQPEPRSSQLPSRHAALPARQGPPVRGAGRAAASAARRWSTSTIRPASTSSASTAARCSPTALEPAADVRARDVRTDLRGAAFTAETPRGRARGRSCATSATTRSTTRSRRSRSASACGLPLEQIAAGLAAAPPVPGRFELVDAGQDFVVAVDYAHKPDALAAPARERAPSRAAPRRSPCSAAAATATAPSAR